MDHWLSYVSTTGNQITNCKASGLQRHASMTRVLATRVCPDMIGSWVSLSRPPSELISPPTVGLSFTPLPVFPRITRSSSQNDLHWQKSTRVPDLGQKMQECAPSASLSAGLYYYWSARRRKPAPVCALIPRPNHPLPSPPFHPVVEDRTVQPLRWHSSHGVC